MSFWTKDSFLSPVRLLPWRYNRHDQLPEDFSHFPFRKPCCYWQLIVASESKTVYPSRNYYCAVSTLELIGFLVCCFLWETLIIYSTEKLHVLLNSNWNDMYISMLVWQCEVDWVSPSFGNCGGSFCPPLAGSLFSFLRSLQIWCSSGADYRVLGWNRFLFSLLWYGYKLKQNDSKSFETRVTWNGKRTKFRERHETGETVEKRAGKRVRGIWSHRIKY